MFTKLQSQILAILIENSQKEFYLSQIGQLLGKHPGVFQRGLKSLEKQSYVKSRRQGNQRLFIINSAHPFFNEIKSIIQKTFGAEAILRGIVKSITGIKTAFIYGSYVKNKLRADSDIDLLVVLSRLKAEDELLTKISNAEKKLGREINYKAYSLKEFSQKVTAGDPFLTEILSEQIILLKGDIK